jgi:D-3-phosphoglycerate dehydrogenase
MSYKVVFTDYDFDSIDIEKEVLRGLDCKIVELQTKDEEKLTKSLTDADAIIVQYAPISSKVIENMNKCKVISRYGIGVDMIDIVSATKKGINVCNVPDYCLDEVADHTIALILALNRKIIPLNASVKNGVWNVLRVAKPIYSLKNLTLGIVGFGKIPQNLYPKVKTLFGNILIYDPYIPKNIVEKYSLNTTTFYNLLRNSDYISIHCPLVEETHHLFSIEEFQLMKPTSHIINTSRGPIINTKDLYQALNVGHISGAALDVLEEEPPGIDNAILKLGNTIITPHAAYYSESAIVDLKEKTALNVVRVLKGEEPVNLVNKN